VFPQLPGNNEAQRFLFWFLFAANKFNEIQEFDKNAQILRTLKPKIAVYYSIYE